jgi:hypothetical protein
MTALDTTTYDTYYLQQGKRLPCSEDPETVQHKPLQWKHDTKYRCGQCGKPVCMQHMREHRRKC